MLLTTTAGPTVTIRPHPHGADWGMVLESNDPLYRYLRAAVDLFLAGLLDTDELADIEMRWSVRHENGASFRREHTCPAVQRLLWLIALALMEPSCICVANWDGPPCIRGCEPLDRQARLRELIGAEWE